MSGLVVVLLWFPQLGDGVAVLQLSESGSQEASLSQL